MAEDDIAPLALTFKCTGCNEEKPVSAFRRDAAKPRGFSTRCRACTKARDHARASLTIAQLAPHAKKCCRRCNAEKPLTDFAKDLRMRDGRCTICRPCARAYAEEWRERRRRGEDTSKKLAPRKRAFGVLESAYDQMLNAQGHACAICEVPFERRKPNKNINIDHDHSSLQIRGLLCTLCNFGIGTFKDDIQVLERAIAYLKKHKAAAHG